MALSQKSLPAVFSNLAKATDKQQNSTEAELFAKLAEHFFLPTTQESSINSLKEQIAGDLADQYPELQGKAELMKDRGVLRALKWGKKVTILQKSLIERYLLKGDNYFAENKLFVCEACGFIFLGDTAPSICPVCKAPQKRFSKVS